MWIIVVEGMPYEAQEVQVWEELSSQILLCEAQEHMEWSESHNCIRFWFGCNFWYNWEFIHYCCWFWASWGGIHPDIGELYLHHRKGGIGRTTFGLYVSSGLREEVLNWIPLSHLNIPDLAAYRIAWFMQLSCMAMHYQEREMNYHQQLKYFLLVGFKLLEGWIPQKQLSTGGRKLRLY